MFDGFADWEPAFALTGLRRWGGKTVTTVGYDLTPVTSMGGLRVVPDRTLADLSPEETEILLERHAPGAGERGEYTESLAVTDDGVISASGLGAVEFAAEIFAALHVFNADTLRQYAEMYREARMPAS